MRCLNDTLTGIYDKQIFIIWIIVIICIIICISLYCISVSNDWMELRMFYYAYTERKKMIQEKGFLDVNFFQNPFSNFSSLMYTPMTWPCRPVVFCCKLNNYFEIFMSSFLNNPWLRNEECYIKMK